MFSLGMNCLIYIFLCSAGSFIVVLIGALITYAIQGKAMAIALFNSYVLDFNGVLVAGFGFGLLFFLMRNSKTVIWILLNQLGDEAKKDSSILNYFYMSFSWKWCIITGLPCMAVGAYLLFHCGYPLQGFARFYLAVTSMSLYFAGSVAFSFFVYSMIGFLKLDKISESFNIVPNFIELEAFSSFFIVASITGVIALYLAFRGVLTANFANISNMNKYYLFYPVFLFLPAPLIYSFYPKTIIKKMYDRGILNKINEFELKRMSFQTNNFKETVEIEKLLLEIKEKLILEKEKIAIFSYKDSIAVTLVILILIQFIIENDSIIKSFKNLFMK